MSLTRAQSNFQNSLKDDDMDSTKIVAAYGSWKSPISANMLTAQNRRITEPRFDGDAIYWLESRPDEKGRSALVRLLAGGEPKDVLAAPHSVRTRAHEYGGGAYVVSNGVIYCVLDADQRVYRIDADNLPVAISPEGIYRYADFCVDNQHQRLICVREDHTDETEERNEIIAIALDGTARVDVLVSGADFYSNPSINKDGTRLSWLCWNHPQMPWDGTECFIGQLDSLGTIEHAQCIAGGVSESIFQPRWSPDGDLFFASDRSNWWNIYRYDITGRSENMGALPADFATPQWVFGMSTFDFLDSDNLLCCYSQSGQWHLATLNWRNKKLQPVSSDLGDISGIACFSGRGLFIGANALSSPALYCYQAGTQAITLVAQSSQVPLTPADLSQPQAISFTTRDNDIAHGFFYSPRNSNYLAPPTTLPPLLVMCHGGPTAATDSSLNLKIQFWTSRGFAVLDVNYRGSTGYGRSYRERLNNNWGITDVIDVCSGADYVINQGWADSSKIAIRGSSAGGYTVLAALTFTDRFTAGASLYGIGNLESLAKDTHKFESRYLDTLVGKYPEEIALYHQRSPLFHIDKLDCPVIFLQGLQDKVVPPNQAEAIVNALTDKGIANAYVTFTEEGHGFRQAENIQRAIEAELYFYSKIFGFALAEPIAPIAILHLQETSA
jgi:dipeptidyl aminopeptidase/acylaminoacyl peptidase